MAEESNHPTISGLLVHLADNPSEIEEFKKDPDGVMTRFGLTPGQQEIVRSGNLGAIRDAIDYEYRAGLAPGILPDFRAGGDYGADSLTDSSGSTSKTMVVTWRVPRPTWG